MAAAWNHRSAMAALVLAIVAAGCGSNGQATKAEAHETTTATDASPGASHPPAYPPAFHLGRTPSAAEIKAWDIDVNPTGASLPKGSGTYESGAKVFATKCAACHGAHGEGTPPAYPTLVGPEPRDFSFADDFKKTKTIGNYWPYATTLYDYINRAMPLTQPGSLTPDEIYSLVAWLLAENQVIGKDGIMDARRLREVRMPGRDRFVPDDRHGGPGFK